MTDPLKKLLAEEQKKVDAKLRYRSSSQGEVKLPDVLPNLIPFTPQGETPAWTKHIKPEDSVEIEAAKNKQKEKQAKLNGVVGQPSQQRGKKRRLK
jgi:hypothetical protein|tara:strand:- start:392 stop:679 length:288 start_codon:yes stop_codon:yes gene_type:complete